MTLTREEQKLADIQILRPIDDIFFEVLAQEPGVCEEILRTIMEDDSLVVKSTVVQDSLRNLYGRSVRLDALCVLKDGTIANIEVQRSNRDNHIKRARFHAASITVKESEPGDAFEDVPDMYIIFISEMDFIGEGQTIYHMDKVWRETGTIVNDGLHEIFVNTAVNNGSKIAELMSCFKEPRIRSEKFPRLRAGVNRIKDTERGRQIMCDVMEKYYIEGKEEGIAEGKAAGIAEGKNAGQEKLFTLLIKMGEAGEIVDIRELSSDREKLSRLYKKYQIE